MGAPSERLKIHTDQNGILVGTPESICQHLVQSLGPFETTGKLQGALGQRFQPNSCRHCRNYLPLAFDGEARPRRIIDMYGKHRATGGWKRPVNADELVGNHVWTDSLDVRT